MGETNRQKNKKNHNRLKAADAPFFSSMQHKSHIPSGSKKKPSLKEFHAYLKTRGINPESAKNSGNLSRFYIEYLSTL